MYEIVKYYKVNVRAVGAKWTNLDEVEYLDLDDAWRALDHYKSQYSSVEEAEINEYTKTTHCKISYYPPEPVIPF